MTTTLAFSALVCLLIRRMVDSRLDLYKAGTLLILVLLAVFWLPVGSLTIKGYLTGIFGDISSFSAVTLLWLYFGSYWEVPQPENRNFFDLQPLYVPLALASMIFYPLTLGLSRWDPYSIGYQPLVPSLMLALAGIGLVYFRKYLSASFLAIVLVAYLVHLQDSDNLWDYLLDPLLAIVLWIWLLKWLVVKIRSYSQSFAR